MSAVHRLLLIIFVSNISLNEVSASYHLYHSNQISENTSNVLYYDCLLHHMMESDTMMNDKRYRPVYQIIQYCLRPLFQNTLCDEANGSISTTVTFEQLRKKNVLANDLLLWSASIHAVESYQEYLLTSDPFLSIQTFFNCTRGWFGSCCQYTFDSSASFDAIVKATFSAKASRWSGISPLEHTNLTCYMHLQCDRGPGLITCLDWREVCDGNVDCSTNGVDEIGCLELEVNKCDENEFQCHNGMCIPEGFFNDDPFNPDCLDSSDEYLFENPFKRLGGSNQCFQDPAFRCEESDHPFAQMHSICGDGERRLSLFVEDRAELPCRNYRNVAIRNSLYSYEANSHLGYQCWLLLYCFTYDECSNEDDSNVYQESLERKCSQLGNILVFPHHHVLAGHIRFAYSTNRTFVSRNSDDPLPLPDYICFDLKRTPFLPVTVVINNFTCAHTKSLGIIRMQQIQVLSQTSLFIDISGNETHCLHSSLFHCPGTTKCISQSRLLDGNTDCYGGADEIYNMSCALNDRFRFQCTSEEKCLSRLLQYNEWPDCRGEEDEDEKFYLSTDNVFLFQHICNGYPNMKSELIDGEQETDETHCEQWPCDNIYTRCDDAWSCSDGIDERYCGEPWCAFDQHSCISIMNRSIICLPFDQVGDNITDCLGASDEREYCQVHGYQLWDRYRCANTSFNHIQYKQCVDPDDVCSVTKLYCPLDNSIAEICDLDDKFYEVLSSLSDHALSDIKYKHFQLQLPIRRKNLDLEATDRSFSSQFPTTSDFSQTLTFNADSQALRQDIRTVYRRAWLCNRGILVFIGKESTEECLCPPSYYGDRCQYQSQRVSLTLQFCRSCAPECRGVFGLVLTLLDDDDVIHSQEQIIYAPTRDCDNKFNNYLLYRFRPKSMTKQYHIRIDAYNKQDLRHYSSWILPISFLLLPVNRMAARLIIPSSSTFCELDCGDHGQCTQATNNGELFCRCHSGWLGTRCTIPYECHCSPDAVCLQPTSCLCPLTKRGPRCFLNSTCQPNPCKNGGICVPNDKQSIENIFNCVCSEGFSGMFCQNSDSRIDISFGRDMRIPQILLAHFIHVRENADPLNTVHVRKIPYDRDSTTFYTDSPFHLIFNEINNDYYLVYMKQTFNTNVIVVTELTQSKRCPHIRELFDTRTATYPLIRRVKYYHVLCVERIDLTCFRDNEAPFLCICDREQHANCFKHSFNQIYNCGSLNGCENGAQCYLNRPCPMSIACACPECYYGTRCQFSTRSFGITLDAILGYHIRRASPITEQSAPIKVTLAFIIIMLLLGILSSTLSIVTFKTRSAREVGCGHYLLASSITSVLTIFVFTYKFVFLVVSQLMLITNRTSLRINCISIDFVLRTLLAAGDWLNAAVAAERILAVIRGIDFNKKKSRHYAHRIIVCIFLFTLTSLIHDPLYRDLVEDTQEERTWCVVRYTHHLNMYNSVINVLHFFLPYSINFVSAFVIIITVARNRSAVQKNSHRRHLRQQFHQHKHLIISPFFLVILGMPRVVISLISACMKSARDPWLFLMGYLISFIPPILIYFIFVVPSEMYRKQLSDSLQRWQMNVRQRLSRQ